MKGLFFYFFIFLFFYLNFNLYSQDIDAPYFIYEKGAEIKIGHFNKRNIPQGYTVYKVTNVNETDSVDYIVISAETFDPYEKPLNSIEINAFYHGGEISLDMLYLIPVDTLAAISETNWNLNGRNFIMPAFLGNGMSLMAAYVELETADNRFIKVSEFGRVVDKFENLKIDIGEFETCLISSKLEMKFAENELYTIYTWYSKGIGPIRTNYYNNKRKLVKYSEVVEITMPEKS
ncbi:MAG: hypothetical protein PHW82_02630 [Bacteroidales bacterium]|nr:hypothetical protein [Bacteroidales bacterium]